MGTWTYLRIPADTPALAGAKGQVKVKGRIDGHPYRGVAQPEGDGTHYLVVKKAIRDAIGKHAGATVTVEMETDDEPRAILVPDDLTRALAGAGPAAAERFAALSYSHQREHVEWIEEAKKPETRARRVQAVVTRVTGG